MAGLEYPVRLLTISATARRLNATTDEVEELAEQGLITRRLIGDHYSITESSVDAYLAVRADRRPSHRGGPDIGPEADREYDDSKADFDDAPDDEGDND